MPEGYEHSNPSGEAEIFYDDKDMPVKAEIDGSSHELTASSFKGIPPNPNLRSVIKTGVKRARF